jgi:hypothetical protein
VTRRRKPLLVDKSAEDEIDHAIDYLETERLGLGRDFHKAMLAALDRIAAFPKSFESSSKAGADGRR